MNTDKFQRGDQVEVNGNKQGRILGYYGANMVEVRLWDGLRHVGDVCVDINDVHPIVCQLKHKDRTTELRMQRKAWRGTTK